MKKLLSIIVAMVIASYFLTKHQDKIENYFLEKFTRKKKNKNSEEPPKQNTED